MARAHVIALLGAESTGKSTTAVALARALDSQGHSATVIPEVLREFCDLHRRTPLRNEQCAIADEQSARIDHAAQNHDIVVADTSHPRGPRDIRFGSSSRPGNRSVRVTPG